MSTYYFLNFLGDTFVCLLILRRNKKAVGALAVWAMYEYWLLVSSKAMKFEALRDANEQHRSKMLESFKKRKSFGKKVLMKKFLDISARTSEFGTFHFDLFDLLIDQGPLTSAQCAMFMGWYAHLSQTQMDILIDILHSSIAPAPAKSQ